jgi:hypothetical protein
VIDRPELRASDADRDAVAETLRRSHLEGRLSVEELEERLDRAHHAVTLAELETVRADLPKLPAAPRRRAPARRPPRMPGRLSFAERIELSTPPTAARDRLLEHLVPPMLRYGYTLDETSPQRLAFRYRSRPGWTILVAVFAFPVGLIALAHTAEERVVVELEPRPDGGTLLIAHGTAPRSVRRAFAALDD